MDNLKFYFYFYHYVHLKRFKSNEGWNRKIHACTVLYNVQIFHIALHQTVHASIYVITITGAWGQDPPPHSIHSPPQV